MSVELSGYRLEVERRPSDGPVVAVRALCVGTERFDAAWFDDELPGLLRAAREIAGDRDPGSEMMPDDESLLRACLADLRIEVDGEPADVAALPALRPVISQDAAHEMLAALRDLLKQAEDCRDSTFRAFATPAMADARAAIAKAEGSR
jgi:hypothetical protein